MKNRFVHFGIGMLVFTVLGVIAHVWFFWSPCRTIVKGQAYEGLVMDPRSCNPQHGPWCPTVEEIRQLEERLPGYVKSPVLHQRLQLYRRIYTGVTSKEDKKRRIVVHFYAPSIASRRQWLNGITISGGAPEDNWMVLFEPSSGSFTPVFSFEYVAEPN